MRTISKALAGGLGAAVAKIATQAIKHYLPGLDSDAVEYAIYTVITGLAVYIAPANAPPAPPA